MLRGEGAMTDGGDGGQADSVRSVERCLLGCRWVSPSGEYAAPRSMVSRRRASRRAIPLVTGE